MNSLTLSLCFFKDNTTGELEGDDLYVKSESDASVMIYGTEFAGSDSGGVYLHSGTLEFSSEYKT